MDQLKVDINRFKFFNKDLFNAYNNLTPFQKSMYLLNDESEKQNYHLRGDGEEYRKYIIKNKDGKEFQIIREIIFKGEEPIEFGIEVLVSMSAPVGEYIKVGLNKSDEKRGYSLYELKEYKVGNMKVKYLKKHDHRKEIDQGQWLNFG